MIVESLSLNQDGFSILAIDVQKVSSLHDLNLRVLTNNKDSWKMVLLKFGGNKEQIIRWVAMKKGTEELKTKIDIELKRLKKIKILLYLRVIRN